MADIPSAEKVALNENYGNGIPTNFTTVSAKLPADLFTYLENWRWDNRYTKTQLLIAALTEWATSKGFTPHNEDSKTGGA